MSKEDWEKEVINEFISSEKLPFWERLKIYWDFDSFIKHIWLTGYILITWSSNDYTTRRSRNVQISFYRDGDYG